MKKRAEKLKGSLAVIANNAPLREIIEEYASPQWLEADLCQLKHELEVDIF